MELPESLNKLGALLVTTVIIWLSVAAAGMIGGGEFVRAIAVILALISTMTIWTLWALNEYGIGTEAAPGEKAKRDAGSGDDPRLALLLSLFTPDERDTLRSRLTQELEAEGETVSLADLLADHEHDNHVMQK